MIPSSSLPFSKPSPFSEPPLLPSGLLFQVLSVLLSLVGDMLVSVYRSEGGKGEPHGLLFGGREQGLTN